MPHFCAVKTCTNTAKPGTTLSFHRLPTREPERLKLWLLALNVHADAPVSQLRKYIVCSEHFVPDDYTVKGQPGSDKIHRFLTPTAVPSVSLQSGVKRSEDNQGEDASRGSSEDIQPSSEEPVPSLQQCDIKMEQILLPEEKDVQMHLQVKEEQVDWCDDQSVAANIPYDAEITPARSEPIRNSELLSPSMDQSVSLNESTEQIWKREDGSSSSSSSSQQSYSVEVYVELEQPAREEKSCRICGKSFKRDSHLIRHVDISHKGQKAFKCMECNKEFEQRYQLVMHIRIHTGERPFSCEFCGKTFAQNSSRLAHLRMHTGEKPYFCAKCGKGFTTSNHFKVCKVQNERKLTESEKVNHEEEKAFKCFECNKEFNQKRQLVRHAKIHSGEKPFSCDFCDKTFTQNCNRLVHMRQHTKEKPYFCDKCGKSFARSHHLKYCTAMKNNSINKSFRCTTCGKTFHTDSELKVHTEVHKSWKRHVSEKLQGQESEEKSLQVV